MTTQSPELEQKSYNAISEMLLAKAEDFRIKFRALADGIPEAGGIAFTTLYYKGLPINVTARTNDPLTALKGLTRSCDLFREMAPDNVSFVKPLSPLPPTEQQKIVVTDEAGQPAKDKEGQPVTVTLPQGKHLYSVADLFHDQTKNGKDVLKVITVEPPYDTKYGVSCFHGGPNDWKSWPVGIEHKYRPPEGFEHVVVQDPEKEGGYANVIEFRK